MIPCTIPSRLRLWIAAVTGAALLAACTLGGGPSGPRTPDAVRADLAAHLETARADQQVALALWDRVIFGEVVSCQDAIPVPDPVALPASDVDAYPDATPILVALNAAIGHVRDAASLWDIACGEPGEVVSLDVARGGRAAALAATDSLDDVAARLAAWPASGDADTIVQ